MAHASELSHVNWSDAHTIINADYLSDLYTDTYNDNNEADTNIDFGLLDIDTYVDSCGTHNELYAC